ncbi:MAG: hypothetical protein KDB27_32990, partial [Planctomycetales bacterium]|nr:hypothetical protein [Planctomycetales bacterium]
MPEGLYGFPRFLANRGNRTRKQRQNQLRIGGESLESRVLLAANEFFFSGIADFNGSVVSGSLIEFANQGNQSSGGALYSNQWVTDSNGNLVNTNDASVAFLPDGTVDPGTMFDAVTEIGVVPIGGARVDPTTNPPVDF